MINKVWNTTVENNEKGITISVEATASSFAGKSLSTALSSICSV